VYSERPAVTIRDIDIMAPAHAMPAQTAFVESMKALASVSRQEFSARADAATGETASYEESGQSLILYADDILNSTLVIDLENTIKNVLGNRNILTGGKIVLYSKNPASAVILEKMIKRADPNLQTVIISADQLQPGMSDAKETDFIVRAARAKGAKGILAVIRGPAARPDKIEELSEFAKDFDNGSGLPIIIAGPERGIYSFAQAISMAIYARIHNGSSAFGQNGWLIILPPIRAWTEDIRRQYEEYQRSLAALVAA